MAYAQTATSNAEFDDALSRLLILITHHSLKQEHATLASIVESVDGLLQHPDIEFFPQQQEVLIKMRKLWLMRLAKNRTLH